MDAYTNYYAILTTLVKALILYMALYRTSAYLNKILGFVANAMLKQDATIYESTVVRFAGWWAIFFAWIHLFP